MKNELLLKCCTTCKVEKPFDNFSNAKKYKDGKYYECKLCQNSKAKINRLKRGDEFKEYSKKYRQSNKYKEYIKTEKYLNYKKTLRSSNASKQRKNIRQRKERENLHSSYLILQLRHKGFSFEQLMQNPEIIEAQKEIIKIKRLCKI
jgi:hypothetical protein